MKRQSHWLILPILLILGAAVFFAGIGWGLPSRDPDHFLFGDHPVWSGREILALAGPPQTDPDRAADVSSRPIDRRDRWIVVNDDDRERARIVRRYRLMSYQPDEYATFAALASMNPRRGNLDPRLYQYGGAWVYGVGGLLKVASALHLVRVTSDLSFYLDRPDEFDRFYIVARFYSAIWGLAGIVAIYLIVRRIAASAVAATAAVLCYMAMPVVINASHEAKPHLAGAVLILFAVLAAARFAESSSRRARLSAALLCGLAVGMVLSSAPVLLLIPAMHLLERHNRRRPVTAEPGLATGEDAGAAGPPKSAPKMARLPLYLKKVAADLLVAIGAYSITNPYVIINLIRHNKLIRANLGNTAEMFRPSWTGGGVPHAAFLVGLGGSFLLVAVGAVGAVMLAARAARLRQDSRPAEVSRRSTGLLLAIPALAAGAQFALFAAEKPGEYARFSLPLDLFLLVEAVVAIATFVRPPVVRLACFGVLVMTTAAMGSFYVRGFVRDSSGRTTRIAAAQEIQSRLDQGDRVLVSAEEPAPWSLPPVDLFRWTIVVPPRRPVANEPDVRGQLEVSPADFPPGPQPWPIRLLTSTPLSWADKPFNIRRPNHPQ